VVGNVIQDSASSGTLVAPARSGCFLTVVVPAYNEQAILRRSVYALTRALAPRCLDYEVVIVENGSRDRTRSIARDIAKQSQRIRFMSLDDADYGAALHAGFASARGEFVTNAHVDCFDAEFMVHAIRMMDGHDVVVGSKYLAASTDERPTLRRVFGRCMSVFARALLALPVSDTHGFMLWRTSSLRPLLARCRFAHEVFDTELIAHAKRRNLRIGEIPMSVREIRPSRLSSVGRAVRMVAELLSLRWQLWRANDSDASQARCASLCGISGKRSGSDGAILCSPTRESDGGDLDVG